MAAVAARAGHAKDWVGNFLRQGDIEFQDGEILLGKGGSDFPARTGETPGNVVDHDASFGDLEPRGSYGRNVCGDVRARMRVASGPDGAFTIRIVR